MSKYDDYSEPQEMTTTEMIAFLQQFERGGASGKSREITFWVNDKPYSWVALSSTGDGLVTDIDITISPTEAGKK